MKCVLTAGKTTPDWNGAFASCESECACSLACWLVACLYTNMCMYTCMYVHVGVGVVQFVYSL